ncbi:hypothetical protein [Cystobacter fuscus]|uniref:hypothetical protein n=1 Tax=Cystobacter fuscus TaxID=43 RepID=UPI0037BFD56A
MESKLLCDRAALFLGDAARVSEVLAPNSIDAIVTDPPAGISFMGRDWDSDKGGRDSWIAWLASVMREALRVLKPGGHAKYRTDRRPVERRRPAAEVARRAADGGPPEQ